jgi:hypothetical protein
MRQREATLERRCAEIATDAGCLLLKLHHGLTGIPDRLLLAPDHASALIEFKAQDGSLSPIQAYWQRRLTRLKHPVYVIRSTAEFRALLTSLGC